MYDRIKFSSLLLVLKHNGSELRAVERSVLLQNIRAKCGYDLVKGLGARADDVPGEDVGINDRDPAGGQQPGNCRFSCCDTTCKTYDFYMALRL